MLIDEATIKVTSGSGGDGRIAYYINRGKPCGGDGGRGGNVSALINPQMTSLLPYVERKEREAESGGNGGTFNKSGRNADELVLYFPPGTHLTDLETGEVIELTSSETPVQLCRGGNGGWGNATINLSSNHLFDKANPGQKGNTRCFKVAMKLIADFGLVGFPNAGKSSLLNVLTAAQARVADYPFTTLEPNLGVLYGNHGYTRRVLADIPGLIEGASEGKGLGVKFLKHIEKVSTILHCISCESTDPLKDYHEIRAELGAYNPSLLQKKEIVILTKSDLIADDKKRLAKIQKQLAPVAAQIVVCSIADDQSIETIKAKLIEDCH
jgi:GTP-binding protein